MPRIITKIRTSLNAKGACKRGAVEMSRNLPCFSPLYSCFVALFLVSLTALNVSGQSVILESIHLPGIDFPDGGTTDVFTTSDSNVVFTTANAFNVQGDWVADNGGTNPNTYEGSETLSIDFAEGVALQEFAVRWTRTDIIITGLAEDPQAVVGLANGTTGSATWDAGTQTLTLDVPWDNGSLRTVSFGNAAASEGRNLLLSFAGASGYQACFVSFDYGVVADSPLVYYSFDDVDVTPTQVNDLTTNGHHAAIIPSVSAPVAGVEGLFGEAFQFVGGDDPDGVVQIPAGVIPAGSAARTISAWFLQEDEADQNKLFGYGTNVAGRLIDLGLEGGGLRLRHYGGFITYGSGGLDSGWHHVALRVNADATDFADVDVFLDGNLLVPQAGGATNVTLDTADAPFFIGSGGSVGYRYGFDGRIDEFKVWSGAVSDAAIQNLAERPPLPAITSFLPSPQNRVPAGTSVTLSWAATNFTSLTLDPGGIDVSATNSTVVTPSTNTTYTLTAANADGSADSRTLTIVVGDEPFPNIVVFFLDDFGWADWEQNGSGTGSVFHETPNMNRLASEGIYFPSGYASTPVCSPTRGSLMTGQSPAYNKVSDWISGSGDAGQPIREAEWVKKLELSNSIFPEVLAQHGYRAIHLGKWHLGHGEIPEANPINHGFQINIGGNQYGTPPGPERYFASNDGFSNLPNLGSDVAPTGSYLTDVLTEQAVEQIRTAASEDTAFVMYMAHYAVHTPIQAPAATVQKYQNKLNNNPGMDWQGQNNPTYAAMVEHVDRSLGDILAALEDPDDNPLTDDSIATNTLVVFTADNGGLIGVTSNRPLRDGKGGNYEGGVREPWVFWWPGTIAPGINSEPVISHDLYPTVLSAAGLDVPQEHVVNGQNLTPLLTGGAFERQSPLVFHYPHWSPAYQGGTPHSAVRQGDWKLIYEYATANWKLYNLANDIGESTNLIGSETNAHEVLSWLLADGLETLDANYPRNTGTLAEEPPVPLVRADVDSDSDNRSDFQEAVEGTDPLNELSFFAPTLSATSTPYSVAFPGREKRTYTLVGSDSLVPESWSAITNTGPLPADQDVSMVDPAAPSGYPARFYRVQTVFP